MTAIQASCPPERVAQRQSGCHDEYEILSDLFDRSEDVATHPAECSTCKKADADRAARRGNEEWRNPPSTDECTDRECRGHAEHGSAR